MSYLYALSKIGLLHHKRKRKPCVYTTFPI